MPLRVGINGFGRIGRLILRQARHDKGLEFVAVNDITDAPTLAHLLKYDSVHGRLDAKVEVTADGFTVDGRTIKVLAEKEPSHLPWKALGVDLVVEGTGKFTKGEQAKAHLDAGAKWVLITAPAKGVDATIVFGVNHTILDPAKHKIVSNGSCTTNCLAPVVKVLLENFGIAHGLLTTVHAYTNEDPRPAAQGLAPRPRRRSLDDPHLDRRSQGNDRGVPAAQGKARRARCARPDRRCVAGGLHVYR
jgi:glyceraldehyde 3-phosphate dehydrogenase